MQPTEKIVSLQAARLRKLTSVKNDHQGTEPDQRDESREKTEKRLFVQITQASDPDLIGKTISCRAIDTSAHGVKFLTSEKIPVGCFLALWIDDATRPGKFFLTGDARWTRQVGSASTMVGVRLQEGAATDLEEWKTTHST